MTLQDFGIAVSAVGSVVLVGIQIVRFTIERSHLVVRLSCTDSGPNNPEGVWMTCAVFNRGRPAFIDGMYLMIGKERWWISNKAKAGQELPADLATGRSYRISFDFEEYELEWESTAEDLGYPTNGYNDDDLPQMRLRVTDGEGHDHSAHLSKDSLPEMARYVKVRKDRRAAAKIA